jgi:hypothetical protein
VSNDGRSAAGASGGAVYGLGLIGAAIYYFQQASDFWSYVFALPKAILWPAFVVYHLLEHLG